MIKNKKYLWLGLPLFISPVAIIASCTNQNPPEEVVDEVPSELPSDNLSDIEKAMANIKARLVQDLSLMHLFKPSQIGPTEKNTSTMLNLPYQDPRQLFGFNTKYKTIKDDNVKGEKTVEVTLSRGETIKKTLVIKGFLTEEAEQNEKLDYLNPEKVFANFTKNPFLGALQTKGNVQVFLGNQFKIKDILELKGQDLIDKIKKSFLMPSADQSKFEIKALGNPVQWKTFWINENIVKIDIQIVEKTDGKTKPRKSGIYSVKIMGFEEDKESLHDEASFNAGVYTFGSFHTPIKHNADSKKPYLDKKASEIKTTEDLKPWLDEGPTSYVKAEGIELVEGSANDEEGSLKINVKLTSKFNPKWNKYVQLKLYGFAIETKGGSNN